MEKSKKPSNSVRNPQCLLEAASMLGGGGLILTEPPGYGGPWLEPILSSPLPEQSHASSFVWACAHRSGCAKRTRLHCYEARWRLQVMTEKSVLTEDEGCAETNSGREHLPKVYPRCLNLEHGHEECSKFFRYWKLYKFRRHAVA
jgi:hypothetical protein